MKTVITGGTGLIGRALAQALATAGQEVIVLSRAAQPAQNPPTGVRAWQWDARTADGWGPFLDGETNIVNLAGENLSSGRWTDGQKARIRQSRVDAGAAVIEAVRRAPEKPRLVIQSSGVGYYGPRGDGIIDESTPRGNDFLAEVAVEWEESTAAVEAEGVRRAIIRQGVVLASDATVVKRLALPYRLFAGGPIGSGKHWLSWIHLADNVAAIRFLIEQPAAQGVFNVTSPNPVRFADLAQTLGDVLGRPSWLRAPSFALEAALGEMSSMVLTGQRAVPRRLQELGFVFRYPEIGPALRDVLGRPQSSASDRRV
jgi:uncharacterized protein (TIGR01777 family)